jgi:hypothetical protein
LYADSSLKAGSSQSINEVDVSRTRL